MKRISLAVLCLACLLGTTCQPVSDEQLLAYKEAAAALTAEVGRVKADLVIITDPEQRKRLQAYLDTIEPLVDAANAEIQKAESGGDLLAGILETAAVVAAGFFPPLAPLVLVARSLRRTRKTLVTVFDSVKAGGGPVAPDAAKAVLYDDPAAAKAFKDWKANGAP